MKPSFFISDVVKNYKQTRAFNKNGIIYTWEKYKELYKHVRNEKAIGDASIGYLYKYDNSIPNIKKYLGDVKIILILRNPIEKAISQYNHLTSINAEPLSFKEAISEEENRINECYPPLYHYISTSLYFNQVNAFKKNFSNVKIIFTQNLKSNPEQVLIECCRFLGIDEIFEYNLKNLV